MKSTFNPQMGDTKAYDAWFTAAEDIGSAPVKPSPLPIAQNNDDALDAFFSDEKTMTLLDNDDPNYDPNAALDEELRLHCLNIEAPELESGRIKKPVITATTLETGTIGFGVMLEEFSKGLVSTILLPITAGLSVFRAVCASVDAYRERSKRLAFRAGVEWLASAALVTATVGIAVSAVAFAVAAPALIVASYALKTLYHTGASLYFGIKSYFMKATTAEDKLKKASYTNKAKTHGMLGLASLIVTGLSVVGLILNKLTFGAFSIFAGVCAVTAVAVAARQASKDPSVKKTPQENISISQEDSFERSHKSVPKLQSSLSSNPNLARMIRSNSSAVDIKIEADPMGYDTEPDDKVKRPKTPVHVANIPRCLGRGTEGDCLVDMHSPQFTAPVDSYLPGAKQS